MVREFAQRAHERPGRPIELSDTSLEFKAAPLLQSSELKPAAVIALRAMSHVRLVERVRARSTAYAVPQLDKSMPAIEVQSPQPGCLQL